jgi:hypothetical protein
MVGWNIVSRNSRESWRDTHATTNFGRDGCLSLLGYGGSDPHSECRRIEFRWNEVGGDWKCTIRLGFILDFRMQIQSDREEKMTRSGPRS